MLHACFTPIALCFDYTSWRFYAFYGTNLLTRCHSASSCFLLFFYSRFLLKKIFSEFDKIKAKVPIYLTRRRSPKERWRPSRSRTHLVVERPSRWPHHPMAWAPRAPTDLALLPINSHLGKTLKVRASIHEKYCKLPPSSTLVWEGPEALPGTLLKTGIITRGLLHRHACHRHP
jgi:hypothetical protein